MSDSDCWKWFYDRHGTVWSQGEETDSMVCECLGHSIEEEMEHARLISSTPRMLDALEKVEHGTELIMLMVPKEWEQLKLELDRMRQYVHRVLSEIGSNQKEPEY